MIVDQMGSRRSKLTYDHLPKGTVMGMSFHSDSLMNQIRLSQSSAAVEIFKGELSDEEVVSYLTILNKGEEKRGLSLILEDKKKIESVPRDENLWIQLKETSGFQPGLLSKILNKVKEMVSMDDIDCRGEIKRIIKLFYNQKFAEVFKLSGGFYGIVEHNSDLKKGFLDFLLIASRSYHMNKPMTPRESNKDSWDCRFVVCDDIRDLSEIPASEDIPLTNPRALSKPVADAMFQVYYLIVFALEILFLKIEVSWIFQN